ncbi:sac3 ganp domain protein [Diaporthe amygdali]|uniref:sac3 ganp domain protein n=1 Tax=Phomopsis amygdali TaxID=1214568 RepID=UPI0022FEB2B7|nr:sac3 ganp domain protein [Diaporthe amygdali]KAJ0118100.1 sac3 ganp domain protein [Diaporthe amygdali]
MMGWAAAPGTQGAIPPPPPGTYAYPNPAYTQVQVRQNFSQPYSAPPPVYPGAPVPPSPYGAQQVPPPPPANQPEPAKKKMEWPMSVRQYVQRSFIPDNLIASVSRIEMEQKLREVISGASQRDELLTMDWDNLPLPQQLVMQERIKLRESQKPALGSSPSSAKKRKSFDEDGSKDSSPATAAPWHRDLAKRVSYAADDKRQAMDEPLAKSKYTKANEKRQKRAERFGAPQPSPQRSPTPEPPAGPVIGTCQKLEKNYLRLTAPPKPEVVRPEHILRQTLDLLKKKWRKERNYSYICDQFKSLRQDLTVQRIKNDFTVEVYEIHARIALEMADLGEYNQCQTQLMALYRLGLKGHPDEFKAYRILYFIYTANRSDLNDALADLTTAEKSEPAIKHALGVRSALALGNYHRFFQLYIDPSHIKMGAYLMDMFVDRERLAALCNMCKAYKSDVQLRFITEELGFDADGDTYKFLVDHEAQELLEERDSVVYFLMSKANGHFNAAKTKAFARVDIKGQI